MKHAVFVILTVLLVGSVPAGAQKATHPLNTVPFTDVKVLGGFWEPWITLTREKILPHNLAYCESEGKIDNFRIAAGKKEGAFRGAPWEDSDVYKVIEGAAYCLMHQRDENIERQIDEIIELISGSQQPDGYIDTYFTLKEPGKRWTDDAKHETYCAGHLIEGAIAYFNATGKRTLLDVAIRMADHMLEVFAADKHMDSPQHEEIELALVKLWRLTENGRYLDLAKLFLDRRGYNKDGKPVGGRWGEVCQDHKPVREQDVIVGHAVRAMYLYSAVTDIAGLAGDAGYLTALDRLWQDVTQRKMYVTGGIGDSSRRNEGFSLPYFLPNDTAYAETCASVGMAFWNQRMALLHADAKYADIVEREIYNGILASQAMDGQHIFYCNRLEGSERRPSWQGCACCPTNIVRFLPAIAGYAYAYNGADVYVNQYLPSEVKISLAGDTLVLRQETDYPWEGKITLVLSPQTPKVFSVYLRIPAWCQGAQTPEDLYQLVGKPESGAVALAVNGASVSNLSIEKGYACLRREWKSGDTVTLDLPMSVRRVKAHPKVEADVSRIALQRGPVVYCVENADNPNAVRSISLPPDAPLEAEHHPELLGGVTIIKGKGLQRISDNTEPQPYEFTAIPYYAWNNRTPGFMRVWLPEDPALATPRPKVTIASESIASGSVTNQDTAEALNDQIEPKTSGDTGIPRLTWWNHLGTAEWAQYDFASPKMVKGVEVYWFDDTGIGQCRIPQSWRVLYKENNTWKPVDGATPSKCQKDTYNPMQFAPITTTGLRIEVQLQEKFSGGILEWRVLD
ncbi:MAG TPA: glycoside hydrolase family 127 protein [Candidatus Hydrogenedentes bacterium]|nr:glycoside hydrolase family 127 protein [Candidatus Hydrogenedentota bacterium]